VITASREATEIASHVLDKLDAAWNLGDGEAFAAEFTEDADLINIFGEFYHGRPDVTTRMQLIFDTIFKGSRHAQRDLEIAYFLSPDTVLAVSAARVEVPAGPLAPQARNRQTFILRQIADAWRVAHWHNTSIRESR
jgi:uncharacterized protein (TIGR02246 family)